MKGYYNTIARSYNSLHRKEQEKKLSIIKKIWRPKGLILDIGCGTNIATKYFDKVIGIDKSFNMLQEGTNVCANAENLPFKDKSFDAVLCLTAIHNFNDPIRAINEMKRVLKKCSIAITLLKKSNNFEEIKNNIIKEFDVHCIEEDKDIIFTCP